MNSKPCGRRPFRSALLVVAVSAAIVVSAAEGGGGRVGGALFGPAFGAMAT